MPGGLRLRAIASVCAPVAMTAMSAAAVADDRYGAAGAVTLEPSGVDVGAVHTGAVHTGAVPSDAMPVEAAPAGSAPADPVQFDQSLLMSGPGNAPLDTSMFSRPNVVMPGEYRVDLIVNGQWRGVENITFRRADDGSVLPCYDRALLQRAGVDLARSERGQERDSPSEPLPDGQVCAHPARYVPGAAFAFDQAEQRLYLTVPQFYMRLASASTYVDPSQWTDGVPAVVANYNANVFTTRNAGTEFSQFYTGLTMGANLGPLRLRHSGNFTWTQQRGVNYQRGYIYAQTDVTPWRAQVLAGESSTSGELFDAISFRGVQIASDDRMLPDSQRYYAPVVRGVAQTNARVSIRQRGYIVHETTVAPGPFEIDDLRTMSYGGDLTVTVTEANGETRSFVVPFATTASSLRPGVTRFSATAGQAIDYGASVGQQYIGQFTLQHGVSNLLTSYGGGAFANRYQSALMGVALNTALGGLALDVTLSRARPVGREAMNGSSIRLSYSRNLPNSGTNFSLLAYRYSTKGYLSLRDALALNGSSAAEQPIDRFARLRNRVDVNVSQQLGRAGSVNLNGSAISYWAGGGRTLSFSLNYSTQWRDMTMTASVQRVHSAAPGVPSYGRGANSTLASLNLSIPLGRNARRAPTLTTLVSHDSDTGVSATTSLSSRFGERGDGSLTASANYDGARRAPSGSLGVGYRLPVASVNANVGIGQGYQQMSAMATGGLVLHSGGVTAGPMIGDTVGIVRAPHAQGATVANTDARVNRFGYAVVPSLVPYQLNRIDLDPKQLPDDIELKTSSRTVAPRAGAVVMLGFDTLKARSLLIDAQTEAGRPLPFAAQAVDARTGAVLGGVGQGSRLFVRSPDEAGRIRVEWGRGPGQQCELDYAVPVEQRASRAYVVLTRVCRVIGAPGAADAPTAGLVDVRAP